MMRVWARRTGVAVTGAALVWGGLTGCGGSGGGSDGDGGSSGAGAPDDASKDDFCAAFSGLYEKVLADMDPDDPSSAVAAMKAWVDDMREVGTPEEMPEDARRGFEVFVDAASKIDEDSSMDDLEHLGDDLSEADQKAGDAFGDWATENCPIAMPSVDPSDLPTDPSELESMMSDLTEDAG